MRWALGCSDCGDRGAGQRGPAALVCYDAGNRWQRCLAADDRLAGLGAIRRPAIARSCDLLARPAHRDRAGAAAWAGTAALERHWPGRTISDLGRHTAADGDHDRAAGPGPVRPRVTSDEWLRVSTLLA